MLTLLQNVAVAAGFLVVTFLLGFSFLSVIGWKKTTLGSVAWGFIALLASFHVVAYPLYMLKTSFSLLYILYSVILLAMLASSVVLAVRGKIWQMVFEELRRFWDGFKKTPLSVLVLGFVVLFFLYRCYYWYGGVSDDSYYLPRAMEVITQNTLDISHSFAWFGREVPAYNNNVDASTLEFLRAYLTKLTGLPVTMLAHNGMILALQAITLSSVWTFVDSVTEEKEHAFSIKTYAMIIWISFTLLTTARTSLPIWITRHIWEGKSLLPAVIFPLATAACITLFKRIDELKPREWLSMTIVLVAGIALSIVGVFLPPILYFLLVLSYLLVDRFRHFRRILPGAALSVLPAAVYVGITLWQIVTKESSYFTRFGEVESWTERFSITVDKFFVAVFLACALFVLLRGSKIELAAFVVMPLLLMLTFLNPLFMGVVSKYITTSSVYHRLFWLLPIYLASAYVLPVIFLRRMQPKQVERCLATACFAVCVLFGSRLSKEEGFPTAVASYLHFNNIQEMRTNPYGVNLHTLNMSKIILEEWKGEERPMLLYYNEEHMLNEIRQCSNEIALACLMRPPQLEIHTDLIPGTDVRECDFYATYHEITDGNYLHDMATRLGINYIYFLHEPLIENPEECGFTQLYSNERTLWRVDA